MWVFHCNSPDSKSKVMDAALWGFSGAPLQAGGKFPMVVSMARHGGVGLRGTSLPHPTLQEGELRATAAAPHAQQKALFSQRKMALLSVLSHRTQLSLANLPSLLCLHFRGNLCKWCCVSPTAHAVKAGGARPAQQSPQSSLRQAHQSGGQRTGARTSHHCSEGASTLSLRDACGERERPTYQGLESEGREGGKEPGKHRTRF